MTLNAGSVTVNGAGVASGTGLALALHNTLISAFGASPGAVPQNVPGAQEQIAKIAQAIAQQVIAHILANAVVTIPAGTPVTVSGSATTQTGATTAPAVGAIT